MDTKFLELAIAKGNKELAVFCALELFKESCTVFIDKTHWTICLDNAYDLVSKIMNKHEFTGYLSSLEKKGKYAPTSDKCFGELIIKHEKCDENG